MKLKSWINDTNHANQDDQTRGEEKRDKLNRIVKIKGTHQRFYAKE
jgi:hypothetical protein